MLAYHQLFDSSHTAYRVMAILKGVQAEKVELERIRIMEFFLAMPGLLKDIRLPSNLRSERRHLKLIPPPYENIENPTRLFFEVSPLHEAAVRFLYSKGVLDPTSFLDGYASLRFPRPEWLEGGVFDLEQLDAKPGYRFITTKMVEMPLDGRKGLKARTGLMEYRYDV